MFRTAAWRNRLALLALSATVGGSLLSPAHSQGTQAAAGPPVAQPITELEELARLFATGYAVARTVNEFHMDAPGPTLRNWSADAIKVAQGGSTDEQNRHYWLSIRLPNAEAGPFQLDTATGPNGIISFRQDLFVVVTLVPQELHGCDVVAWRDDPKNEPKLDKANQIGHPWPLPATWSWCHDAGIGGGIFRPGWASEYRGLGVKKLQEEGIRREKFYRSYFSAYDLAFEDMNKLIQRTQIVDSLNNNLKELPAQLFTEEIRRNLVGDIMAQVQAVLDERMTQMRSDLKNEVDQAVSSEAHARSGGKNPPN